ncbi:Hypothetical predicted protein [Octopus vulgaris]|uniref:Uncharacterized protein n=1 Tax=Octopus vulgaris TaxID=6645 RepID=A0AA36F136_OCTVU|nr:Hypothetical predicted protein [Octopus vulgaris]
MLIARTNHPITGPQLIMNTATSLKSAALQLNNDNREDYENGDGDADEEQKQLQNNPSRWNREWEGEARQVWQGTWERDRKSKDIYMTTHDCERGKDNRQRYDIIESTQSKRFFSKLLQTIVIEYHANVSFQLDFVNNWDIHIPIES